MLINNENFKIGIIPSINPFTQEHKKFWKEQKRRCIEGYWSGGKYMPGILYFYVNHWKIEVSKGINSKNKVIGKPFLRDLEWEKGYLFIEARGFSGFAEDEEYHCYQPASIENFNIAEFKEFCIDPEENFLDSLYYNVISRKTEQPKQYLPTREYLRKIHSGDLGKPLMFNRAKNVVEISSRGIGKSFWASGMIVYNFLMDGVYDHNAILLAADKEKPKSETLIGAIDTFYTKGVIKKIQLGLDNMEGGVMFAGEMHSCPLLKANSGSWESGKTVIAEKEYKVGGKWIKRGSKSMIHHRTFKDNEFAANGTRPSFTYLEEIGFMSNLKASLGQLKECTANGAEKFGTIWMSGTGGDMEGGSTEAVKDVFYDPEAYDCLSFKDTYEDKPTSIGLFIPAYMGLNQYKDKEGNTNKEKALGYLMGERAKAMNAKSKQPLNDELQQRPIVPSEAFLITGGNIFPTAELKAQLGFVESCTDGNVVGTNGEMSINAAGKVEFTPDLHKKLRPCDYPMKDSEDTTGCWVIWEQPQANTSYGYYLAGTDPYDQDQAANSVSLGSTFIMKRATPGLSIRDQIVAEYTARPDKAERHHEIVRMGLMYFNNALDLYENEKNTLKMHFDHKHTLYLLSSTPTILKATANSNVNRTYGIHMTTQIKEELEIYARDWLLTVVEGDKLNLHFIYSKPLLKELISYNDTGNFDRVIAFMLCICNRMQFANIISKKKEELKRDPFFTRRLFK